MSTPATPHRNVNPDGLLPPVGFSHATVAAPGRTVFLGGQTGHHADGSIDDGLVAQFDRALANVGVALAACGAAPHDLVAVQVFTTDVAAYRAATGPIGEAWRRHLGRHFPALALVGVTELYDPRAQVEVVATAVVPDGPQPA